MPGTTRVVRPLVGIGARMLGVHPLLPKGWQRVQFPSITAQNGPNVTTVEVDEGTVCKLVGMEFPQGVPRLTFANGPVDNILGQMDIRNGNVVIDVGEIACQKSTIEGDEAELDSQITKVIAHEA